MATSEAVTTDLSTGAPSTAAYGEESSTSYSVVFWVNHIGEIVIALMIILGNGLVLIAVAKEKALQTVTNYFVASLASADLLVGLLGIPCALLGFNGIPDDFYGCLLMNTMIVILTQVSIFALLLIALERFVAIKFPFVYHEKCTAKVAVVFIVISWIAGILVGFLPALGWDKSSDYRGECTFTAVIDLNYMVYFNFLGCVLTPLLVMAGIYCYIFHVVKQTVRQISSMQVQGPGDAPFNLKKEAKAARWFAFILFLFSVCWLPLHIQNIITLLAGKTNFPMLQTFILLSHLNSALNPILYAFANSKFKEAFKAICGMKSTSLTDTTEVPMASKSGRIVTTY